MHDWFKSCVNFIGLGGMARVEFHWEETATIGSTHKVYFLRQTHAVD